MKRNQAIVMYQALLNIKLNKMSEDMTEAILANTLATAEVNDALAKAQGELRKRTIETIDRERLSAYDELATKANALEGARRAAIQAVINDNYKDIITQQERFSKALNAWLEKDVKVELVEVDRKGFLNAMRESEQTLTPTTVTRLAPMFKDYAEVKAEVDMNEIDELLTL